MGFGSARISRLEIEIGSLKGEIEYLDNQLKETNKSYMKADSERFQAQSEAHSIKLSMHKIVQMFREDNLDVYCYADMCHEIAKDALKRLEQHVGEDEKD